MMHSYEKNFNIPIHNTLENTIHNGNQKTKTTPSMAAFRHAVTKEHLILFGNDSPRKENMGKSNKPLFDFLQRFQAFGFSIEWRGNKDTPFHYNK